MTQRFFIAKVYPITKKDLERIASIETRCFGDEKHPMFSPGLTIGSAQKFKNYFTEPGGCTFYVAYEEKEEQQKLVAYMVTTPPSTREKEGKALGYCISNVGVDPDYQGHGIGVALVMHFLKDILALEKTKRAERMLGLNAAPSKDDSLAYLHVRVANNAANIYKACGFKKTMEREAYYKLRTIYVFENRAMLRRYKKDEVARLNKMALDAYKKQLRGCGEEMPKFVFRLLTGRDEKSGRPTAHLTADAHRMQITYGDAQAYLKKHEKRLEKIPYKPYTSTSQGTGILGAVRQLIHKKYSG